MESKSQDIFPLVEQVRLKIKEIIAGGKYQVAIADDADVSKAALNRFIKQGKNIDCVNFAKLLVYLDMAVTDPDKAPKPKVYINDKALKKHAFIMKSLDEINNRSSIDLPTPALIKILKNLLESELIREESKQK